MSDFNTNHYDYSGKKKAPKLSHAEISRNLNIKLNYQMLKDEVNKRNRDSYNHHIEHLKQTDLTGSNSQAPKRYKCHWDDKYDKSVYTGFKVNYADRLASITDYFAYNSNRGIEFNDNFRREVERRQVNWNNANNFMPELSNPCKPHDECCRDECFQDECCQDECCCDECCCDECCCDECCCDECCCDECCQDECCCGECCHDECCCDECCHDGCCQDDCCCDECHCEEKCCDGCKGFENCTEVIACLLEFIFSLPVPQMSNQQVQVFFNSIDAPLTGSIIRVDEDCQFAIKPSDGGNEVFISTEAVEGLVFSSFEPTPNLFTVLLTFLQQTVPMCNCVDDSCMELITENLEKMAASQTLVQITTANNLFMGYVLTIQQGIVYLVDDLATIARISAIPLCKIESYQSADV